MSDSKSVGIIGNDEWALRMARAVSAQDGLELTTAASGAMGTLKPWKEKFPQLELFDDWKMLVEKPLKLALVSVDSFKDEMVIESLLSKGVSVLASAPCGNTISGIERLSKLAAEKDCQLRIDKASFYSPAVDKVEAELEELRQVFFLQYDLGVFGGIRTDIGVHWAKGFGPLAATLKCLGAKPEGLSCQGGDYLKQGITDVARLSFAFSGGVTAGLTLNWYAAEPEERLVISGACGMRVIKFGAEKHVIEKHDKRIRYLEGNVRMKEGDIEREELEALQADARQLACLSEDVDSGSAEKITDLEVASLLARIDVAMRLADSQPSPGAEE